MFVTDSIDEVRAKRWANPSETWGLVPTMGYLHDGHLSLVAAAKAANERVAVTIYVNPTQFAPDEDLSTYPRNLERDLAMLETAGVDLVFTPSDGIMYPSGYQTTVTVGEVTQELEGSARPEHFAGVTTIVSKLFNIVQPTRAYFGQKDAQQVVVLQRMVTDLNFNLELVVCPIKREADGLAMSSRNSYLTEEARQSAPVLYRSLQLARQLLDDGARACEPIKLAMRDLISAEPHTNIDYISIADPITLKELTEVSDACLISLAVYVGKPRLIDNSVWEAVEPVS